MAIFVDSLASHDTAVNSEPFVELSFPVSGKTLPAEHCYALFAGLVHLNAEIRTHQDISILSIPGFGDKNGTILLTKQSRMRIRVPVSKIALVYQFAGKSLKLGKHEIRLGIPEIFVLRPADTLRSRIVTIKGYLQPEPFLEAVERQLQKLGITGSVTIPVDRYGQPLRKTIKIQRFTIVGFTTEISGLSDDHSILLQQKGLGGKRHIGCGYFMPWSGGRYETAS